MGETTGFLQWERQTPTRRPVPSSHQSMPVSVSQTGPSPR